MSMTFQASILTIENVDGKEMKFIKPVFTNEETNQYLNWDEEEPVRNPQYRPEFDINLANGNAIGLIEALGYEIDEPFFRAPIDEAIERIETKISNGSLIRSNPDHTYLFDRLEKILAMLKAGKERGATLMSCA